MKGSLRQRGAASWELRVYAGTDPDPDTGKRRYRTATVVGNRADAERALGRLVAEVQSDRAIGSASTVSELAEAWFAIASTSWAPTTVRETRSILRRCPHLGPHQVADVTPAMIDALYAMLRVRGSQQGGPLAAGTIARVHVVVRSAFSQAQRWGWVWDNPAERAHRIVVPPTEMRPPTPAELSRLLDHVQQRDPVFHNGSATSSAFDEVSSDVDVLVEFDDRYSPSYFDDCFTLEEGLERILGRPVDLVTRASIENPYFLQRVEATREGLFDGREPSTPTGEDERGYRVVMGSDALYREAMELPEDERATLAVRLLASVDEPAVDDSAETYRAWLRDIEHRLDALVSGEDPGEDWDDVYQDLVAEYRLE